jgi:transcription elongation factor Elf1
MGTKIIWSIFMINKFFLCKVCGHNYGDYTWGENGSDPSFNICPCCGTEFGYEDSNEKAIISQRKKWLDKGANWYFPEEKPKDWNLDEQLNNLKYLT